MPLLAVLISRRTALDRAARRVEQALARAGARIRERRVLGPAEACEIPFSGLDREPAEATLAEALGDLPVDRAVLPAAGRRKWLLVADMDSTIIGCECLDELADYVGLKTEIAEITRRSMAGEIDFEGALRARISRLAGTPVSLIERLWRERVRLNPGAATLVATMRAHGAFTVLVTGGFAVFAERVRRAAGFDIAHANALEVAAGRITGRIIGPVLGREAKRTALEHHRRRLGLARHETLAVGDGANDAGMVEAAGLGVAYHAKPVLKAVADAAIDNADLTALLYLQGYRRQSFRG